MKSEVDRKWLTRFESAMTIAWFAMDCCWMNDLLTAAHVLGAIGGVLAWRIWMMIEDDPIVQGSHMATMSWFMMNFFWMASEWTPAYKELANVFMAFGSFMVIIVAVMEKDALAYFRRFSRPRK